MKTSKTPPSYKSEESRKNRLQILTEVDELQGLREEKPKKEKKEPLKEGEASATDEQKADESAEAEAMETDANASQTEAEIKQEAEEAEEAEAQNDQPEIEPILDYNEGDDIGPEIENKIPKYNCKRQVGSTLISKLVCFECRLCNKYFDTEETAEIHSRTYNHHRLFVKFLNEKANETKIAQKRAAAAAEETERLKRVKFETDAEVKTEEVPKSELYDPTEATGDDEPKETTDEPMTDVANVAAAIEEKAEVAEVKIEEKVDEPMIVADAQKTPAPIVSPAATPASNPVATSVAAPVATSVAAPVATPVAVPVATPVSAPVAAPVVVPAAVPVAVPVATPVAIPVATPVAAPVQQFAAATPAQNNQQQNNQQNNQQQQQQNNTPNKFNNNRGRGRGGNNNNRRSGRYGGRY